MVLKRIKFITLNVRSLIEKQRQCELEFLLVKYDIDIAFIQESHLKQNSSIYFRNYSVIRDWSSTVCGIIIKIGFQFCAIAIPNLSIPNVFIKLSFRYGELRDELLLGSVYFPCASSSQNVMSYLETISEFSAPYYGSVIGGDLNIKHTSWGDTTCNSQGVAFMRWFSEADHNFARVCANSPSFPLGNSFLDHFLISSNLLDFFNSNFQVSTFPSFSDHLSLFLSINFSANNLIFPTDSKVGQFPVVNWVSFRSKLCSLIDSCFPADDRCWSDAEIDEAVNALSDAIIFARNSCTSYFKFRYFSAIHDNDIKKMFKFKHALQNKLRRIYHRTGNRSSPAYRTLSAQIAAVSKSIKDSINKAQLAFFSDFLKNIKPGPNAFRKVFNFIRYNSKERCLRVSQNGVSLQDDSDKASAFLEFFRTLYEENNPLGTTLPDCDVSIENVLRGDPWLEEFNSLNSALNPGNSLLFCKKEDVVMCISNISPKKSFGLDHISNKLIKNLPSRAIDALTIIFNQCLNNCYFPRTWKHAKIFPIKKRSNSSDVKDFRPISLLSNLGKILERIILLKIVNSELLSKIPSFQFGFVNQHSTNHALLKFSNDVTIGLRNGQSTVAVSLDIEKAFDRVSHRGLIYKLAKLQLHPALIRIISSFFENRFFSVVVNNSISDSYSVRSGVPQGSILAPTLFNIFLSDFPHQLNGSLSILYADDALVYAQDRSPLAAAARVQSHLDLINDYYRLWGISVNADKSTAVCFRNAAGRGPRKATKESRNILLKIGLQTIPLRHGFRYLGIYFNQLLKFNAHGRKMLDKAYSRFAMLQRILRSPDLCSKMKLILYKTVLRPIFCYGISSWFSFSPSLAKKFEIFERKVIRCCLGKHFIAWNKRFSNKFLYSNSKILPFRNYAIKLILKFLTNLKDHPNPLVSACVTSQIGFNLSNCYYLSPLGLLSEHIILDMNSPRAFQSYFYVKRLSHTHRG